MSTFQTNRMYKWSLQSNLLNTLCWWHFYQLLIISYDSVVFFFSVEIYWYMLMRYNIFTLRKTLFYHYIFLWNQKLEHIVFTYPVWQRPQINRYKKCRCYIFHEHFIIRLINSTRKWSYYNKSPCTNSTQNIIIK